MVPSQNARPVRKFRSPLEISIEFGHGGWRAEEWHRPNIWVHGQHVGRHEAKTRHLLWHCLHLVLRTPHRSAQISANSFPHVAHVLAHWSLSPVHRLQAMPVSVATSFQVSCARCTRWTRSTALWQSERTSTFKHVSAGSAASPQHATKDEHFHNWGGGRHRSQESKNVQHLT